MALIKLSSQDEAVNCLVVSKYFNFAETNLKAKIVKKKKQNDCLT